MRGRKPDVTKNLLSDAEYHCMIAMRRQETIHQPTQPTLSNMKRLFLLILTCGFLASYALAARISAGGDPAPKPMGGNAGPVAEGVYEMVKPSGNSIISLGE